MYSVNRRPPISTRMRPSAGVSFTSAGVAAGSALRGRAAAGASARMRARKGPEEGFFTHANIPQEASPRNRKPPRASRPVQPVPKIAESGQDILSRVQGPVQCRSKDGHLRVRPAHLLQSFGCDDDADKLRIRRAPFLDKLEGLGGGAPGCEHGVDDKNPAALEGRQLAVITAGPRGL